MKTFYKYLICLLLGMLLFPSCNTPSKERRDMLVAELMDSLSAYNARQDGDGILLVVDSLKSLDVKIEDISMYYAVAYAYKGEYDKGIQVLKDSISVSNKPQLLYHELGNIFLGKGDTAQAIVAYKQALDCNPNYARPYLAMAEVYTKKGEKELAMNNYLAAVRIFGEYEAYEEMGIYAAKALKEVDSTNIQMEKFLMYHYMKMNDHRMALAIGLDIDDHCVAQNKPEEGYPNLVFIGMSLYNLVDLENALSMLYKAAGDERTTKDYGYLIYCYASACYRKMGEDENADICLECAKEIDAGNTEAYINDLLKN